MIRENNALQRILVSAQLHGNLGLHHLFTEPFQHAEHRIGLRRKSFYMSLDGFSIAYSVFANIIVLY